MRYVVLGASAAGINGARYIRKYDKEGELILVSEDTAIYSRCILHHYMQGIRDLRKLNFSEEDFIERNRIQWYKGIRVTHINASRREIELSDGETLCFDKLLIATGSHSFIPPIPGIEGTKNIFGFHNLDDCLNIMEAAKKAHHIVVVGGGLVGIDAVSGLLHTKKNLAIVEMKGHMLAMQLDREAARTYENAYSALGVKQYYGKKIIDVIRNEAGYVIKVALNDGSELPCDLLIITTGVRANISFLRDSGIETDRFGLVINSTGQTNVAGVYGAGDVTGRHPIWPVAVKEGIIAATNMTGGKMEMTDFFASKSTMNFLGIPTMSLGINTPEDDSWQVEMERDGKGNYKKVIHKSGKIYGAILQGDLSYAGVLTQLIRRKMDVSQVKKPLFRIDYSDFFHVRDNLEFTYGEENL